MRITGKHREEARKALVLWDGDLTSVTIVSEGAYYALTENLPRESERVLSTETDGVFTLKSSFVGPPVIVIKGVRCRVRSERHHSKDMRHHWCQVWLEKL